MDGFAGRGRYNDDEPGPVIALQELLDHRAWKDMGGTGFVFYFVESNDSNVSSLEQAIGDFKAQRSPWPGNVKTEVRLGPGTIDPGLVGRPVKADYKHSYGSCSLTNYRVDPAGVAAMRKYLDPIWNTALAAFAAAAEDEATTHTKGQDR